MTIVMVTFELRPPFSPSHIHFSQLAGMWGIRIWSASTNSPIVKTSVTPELYQRLFVKPPIIGVKAVPDVLKDFVFKITVTELKNT